ncbi:NYN domain-containing protein [Oceanobacillus sp. CAU 1775]
MNVLLVDGYNIIGDWPELQVLRDQDMAQARDRLVELMAEYQAYYGNRVIVVFDAYEIRGKANKYEQSKVEVIYTKEKETADEHIEGLIKKLKNVKTQVHVATSDYEEQRTIFALGALRMSARELKIQIEDMEREINIQIKHHQKSRPQSKIDFDKDVLEVFEKMRRGES